MIPSFQARGSWPGDVRLRAEPDEASLIPGSHWGRDFPNGSSPGQAKTAARRTAVASH